MGKPSEIRTRLLETPSGPKVLVGGQAVLSLRCAFILLPFSLFRGSCSHYIKVLAIPQTFLDTTAGSVWIVLFLSSLDYIYLAISCFIPWLFAPGLSLP